VKELVEFLVAPFLEHPNAMSLTVVEGASSVLLELRVHDDDYAAVRGDEGRNFQAIQQVVAAAGGSVKPVLDLMEPGADAVEE
jgi:predicted RNA-binding protein YlqC (UPF0109 family)